jgi:hypothetical protein
MLANKLHGLLRFAALSPESDLALPIQRHNWGRFGGLAQVLLRLTFFVLHVLAGLFVLFLSLVRNLQAGNAGRVSHSWKRLDPARFRFAGKVIRCSGDEYYWSCPVLSSKPLVVFMRTAGQATDQ